MNANRAGNPAPYRAALTIAGSDSGGGAGIQADIKTFSALDVFGASAITCVTAQSPDRVSSIHALPPKMVFEQVSVVCEDIPVKAVKTGMLYSAEIIEQVASAIRQHVSVPVVVDPVMVATSGARLLREDAIDAVCEALLPLAAIVTPNIPEAEILSDRSLESVEDAEHAAREIGLNYGIACVVKGGHLGDTTDVTNVLFANGVTTRFSYARIPAAQTHGTGCTFSAALAAYLARGLDLGSATEQAGWFVARALETSRALGKHHPLNFHMPRD